MGDAWYAVFYLNGNSCCLDLVLCYLYLDHTGLAVQGLLLIEDKVADAVIDGLALVALDGLQRVGVMTDQGVGTGINQSVGLQSLAGYRLERVLSTPV